MQRGLLKPPQCVLNNSRGLTSLANYPNQYAAFSINLCTKLMADERACGGQSGGRFMRVHFITSVAEILPEQMYLVYRLDKVQGALVAHEVAQICLQWSL